MSWRFRALMSHITSQSTHAPAPKHVPLSLGTRQIPPHLLFPLRSLANTVNRQIVAQIWLVICYSEQSNGVGRGEGGWGRGGGGVQTLNSICQQKV